MPQRERFLIFCEGETEVGYFSAFNKRARLAQSGNALTIVQNAVAFKNVSDKPYDQYWVVIDKDETTDHDFNRAIQLAETNGIRAAWSNQAFECWIIMHYRDFKHACHRNDYEAMLKQHIPTYRANKKGEAQGRQLNLITSPHLPTAVQRGRPRVLRSRLARRPNANLHPRLSIGGSNPWHNDVGHQDQGDTRRKMCSG